jgi:threonine aldolase
LSLASDNWAGASERVMAALAEANAGDAPAYGGDGWTGRALELLAGWFERDVAAFFVSTGSAANSLALASFARPGGVVFCHADAHIARDEAGAPALFAPGQTLHHVDGPAGRIDPAALATALEAYPPGVVHHGRPTAVSLTNANEYGQCYRPADIAGIAALARSRGLAVHMDGARFANALAFTGASPAELTWRAGVDALSLGLTKTGGWCAEVLVFFDPAIGEDAAYRHKQAAQLLSKNRFAAAQVCALLEDDHVLDLAGHANAMARALCEAMEAADDAAPVFAPQSNEVFAWLAPSAVTRLAEAGFVVRQWPVHSAAIPAPPDDAWRMFRFVASFRTTEAEVDRFRAALAG